VERTQIYLSVEEQAALDRRAEESGQTRSHVIHEAIAAYLQQPTPGQIEEALVASAGAWKSRRGAEAVDGATYVERLRTGRRWQALFPDKFGKTARE
jgi:predicted DNA-binding protein